MRRKAILLLRGGLGNQLFQLCKLATLAESSALDFYVSDLNAFNLQRGFGGAESLYLPIDAIFPNNSPPRILSSSTRPFIKLLVALNNRLGIPRMLDEDSNDFCNLPRLLFVQGYFQDFKIVNQIHVDALNDFIFLNGGKPNPESNSGRVCIHIRRGDYPTAVSNKFGRNYYLKAIRNFQSMGFRSFDCYSDEISTATKILSFLPGEQLNFPEANLKFDSISLLRMMTNYENFILSQSSLAWWASYLAFRNNNKVQIEGKLPKSLDFIGKN